jgi:hypothetical protein
MNDYLNKIIMTFINSYFYFYYVEFAKFHIVFFSHHYLLFLIWIFQQENFYFTLLFFKSISTPRQAQCVEENLIKYNFDMVYTLAEL